jgi:O-antigen/teichoic acid export membrane protein
MVQAGVFWILAPWRPSPRRASWPVLKDMLRYGRFIGATNVVNLANNTIDTIIVGRLLSTAAVGFYSVTYRLAEFPNSVIGYIVGRVLFPVYSMIQADVTTFRRVYVQNIQRIALLSLPLSVLLFVGAEPIVLALLGRDWLEVVTPLKILALYGLVKSFAAPCGEVFRGIGRPQLGLLIAAAHAVVMFPLLLLLTPRYGLEGAATAMLAAMCVTSVPAFYLTFRLLDLRLGRLGRALLPSFGCAAALGVVLALAVEPTESLAPLPGMIMLVAVGAGVYVAATAVFARSIVVPMWTNLRGSRR